MLTQISTHIHSHIILDSQCLIFGVVTADDTQRTLKRRKVEEGKRGKGREMVKVRGSSEESGEK